MRFLSFLVLFLVLLSLPTAALALDVKFQGTYEFAVKWMDNLDFTDSEQDGQSEDDFGARQQFRLQTDFVASEALRGVFFIESGETVWGGDSVGNLGEGSGGAIGSDGVSIEVRRAYVEVTLPDTQLTFTVGIQGFTLPTIGLGDPILGGGGTDMAGVLASVPVSENVSLAAGWFRPLDAEGDIVSDSPASDEKAVFALAAPMNFEGVSVAPYGMLAFVGKDVEDSALWQSTAGFGEEDGTIWWLGSSVVVSAFDPLSIGFDLVYGSTSAADEAEGRAGWYFPSQIDSDLGCMTPGLALSYSTGDDDDLENGSETMPGIDPAFYGTTFGFDGATIITGGDAISYTAQATMGLALILADMSFVDDLTHTARLAYVQGTHDEDAVRDGFAVEENAYLSTEDSAWEVDLESVYTIYENLTLTMELGWISLDRDEDVWGEAHETSDAWKVAFQLGYGF